MWEKWDKYECAKHLDSDFNVGLSTSEAARRCAKYGKNLITVKTKDSLLKDIFNQINDPLIYILIVAAVISIMLGEVGDSLIILAVIVLDSVIGLIQEGKAKKSLKALEKLAAPYIWVIRDSNKVWIRAEDITMGDLIYFEAGDMIPADIRITSAEGLCISEATLTGESVPVEKKADTLDRSEDCVNIGDKYNMAFMSTLVTKGSGTGLVVATGMDTELGKVAEISSIAEENSMTPLQKRLEEMGKILGIFSIAICVFLAFVGFLQHRPPMSMLLVAISLAVAAVPEGLPAVVTICLAVGVTRMAERKTIVRRLPAVETLGAVDVVCSDKTGTLTLNKMTVTYPPSNINSALIKSMILCNNAQESESVQIGDPTELALLDYCMENGYDIEGIRKQNKRISEIPFDSDRKLMSVVVNSSMGRVAYIKGAPDAIISRCNQCFEKAGIRSLEKRKKAEIVKELSVMTSKSLRAIAFAMKLDNLDKTEENLIWLGMVGLEDPLRGEAIEAVGKFKKAGVRTVMITGDHADTAKAYGDKLGLTGECLTGAQLEGLDDDKLEEIIDGVNIFARVSPAQKLRVVKTLKAKGHVVAMTGDGVNDAPSLKAADVGVAMGDKGTETAKQAADIILTDDNFATIECAMEEGRSIYENIRKTVLFLISSNIGEIITMLCAVLIGLPTPLKSGHILWINLITDSLPALALGVDDNDREEMMSLPPRKSNESLFSDGGWACIAFYGMVIGVISLVAYILPGYIYLNHYNLQVSFLSIKEVLTGDLLKKAQTYAFTVLGITQLFHAVGMRDLRQSLFKINHLGNPLMIVAVTLGLGLQIMLTKIPFFIGLFGVVHLSATEWIVLAVLAAVPLLAHEVMCHVQKK